jgi:isoquinoline 1-oxidoreductase subunit beta
MHRAVEDSANVFVIQGFTDELAALAGRDPVDFQLEMLANDVSPKDRRREYDANRLRAVIEMAADGAKWRTRTGTVKTRLSPLSARGKISETPEDFSIAGYAIRAPS